MLTIRGRRSPTLQQVASQYITAHPYWNRPYSTVLIYANHYWNRPCSIPSGADAHQYWNRPYSTAVVVYMHWWPTRPFCLLVCNATSTKLSAKGSAGLTGASWFAVERDPELLAELYQAVPVKASGILTTSKNCIKQYQ